MKREVYGVLLATLIANMLYSAFSIEPVRAIGTITIMPDGSIDPPTAPISTIDNVTYTLTENIYSESLGINVRRNNTVLEGNTHMIQGPNTEHSVGLTTHAFNVTIRNIHIRGFDIGINTDSPYNCSFSRNNITECLSAGIWIWHGGFNNISGNMLLNVKWGISLYFSDGNRISGNNVTGSTDYGIGIAGSSNNYVLRNSLESNSRGIELDSYGSNNRIFHNKFVSNDQQIVTGNGVAVWDDGYPSGGNYWSDYSGVDLYSGSYQNETGSDGMGDYPYVIGTNNRDYYPLMSPILPVPGDINKDGIVDIFDCVIVALAFGSKPGDTNWNPVADINSDNLVDIFDIVVVALHFSEIG